MKKFPKGSTIEIFNGMNKQVFTATDDLRELYIQLEKSREHSIQDLVCYQSITEQSTRHISVIIAELLNVLLTQYRFAIEYTNEQSKTLYIHCKDEEELISKLQDIGHGLGNSYSIMYNAIKVHDNENKEVFSGTLQTVIYKYLSEIGLPKAETIDITIDFNSEYQMLSNIILSSNNVEEKQKASIILKYLADKLASQ